MKITNITFACLICISLLSSCDNISSFNGNINSETDSISYCLGVSFGTHLTNNNLDEIDNDVFMAALENTLNGDSLKINAQRANQYIGDYLRLKSAEEAVINLEEGKKFLEENKEKEGVITLPSGLQYKIINEGDGSSPTLTDKVTTYYKGTLIDGTVFDSTTEDDPRSFGVSKVIAGWTEALQLMKVGSKWQLYVPAELGYGTRVRKGSPIKANMALIFEIELISIEADDPNNSEIDHTGHNH